LLIALVALTSPAFGQGRCFPSETLEQRLATEFNEHLSAGGIALNSTPSILELFICEENCQSAEVQGDGTFTLVLKMASGQSCVIAAGQNWQALDAPTKAKGDAL